MERKESSRRKHGEAQDIVLQFLLRHPHEQFTVREIVEATGLNKDTVRNMLSASRFLPLLDDNRLFSLNPSYNPSEPQDTGYDPFDEGDLVEFDVQGSLPRGLGGPQGKVPRHATADEAFRHGRPWQSTYSDERAGYYALLKEFGI